MPHPMGPAEEPRLSKCDAGAGPRSPAMGRVGLTAEALGGKEWAESPQGDSLNIWGRHNRTELQAGRACDLGTDSKLYSRPRRSH